MSKSPSDDEEEDIYSDLPDFQYDDTLKKLETSKKALEEQVATLLKQLEKLNEENNKLNTANLNLAENISSLYKTANNELRRKDRLIQELRDENDKIIFRKKRFHSQHEYSAVRKDIGSEEKNHNSVNSGASVSANKCLYKEEAGNEELLVSGQNLPQTLIPPDSEQTSKISLFQTNTNNCLKLSDCDLNFNGQSSESSNEQKELNRESNSSIKLKKRVMNRSKSPEIYHSKLEKPSPKPEYLEKHMAHRIQEMSTKYSSRSSCVKMANTVKSKYSKSRCSRSKTPFDITDYRTSKISGGRSPHRRDSEPNISFMRPVSRYSRSRSPPRRNKNYDSDNRYHYPHSKERKYNFKVHINSLDKVDSKHVSSSKKISSSSKSKKREVYKNSIPLHSRYEDKIIKSSHTSKTKSTSKNNYELYKSKVNTFAVYTNEVPAEPKINICKENHQKTGTESKTNESNVLEYFPKTQKEVKYSGFACSETVEVIDLPVKANISATSSSVETTVQQIKKPTVIASNYTRNVALDKTSTFEKDDENKDIVESHVPSRENLEIKETKCRKENSEENKSNFQSPEKASKRNTNLLKTSPTFQDPAIFKGGSVSICMFNEQADFTRKRKRAKLVITNKLPVESEIVSNVTTESINIINSNNSSSKQDPKYSSINDCQELKKYKSNYGIENIDSKECNPELKNAYNDIEDGNIKISYNTDIQVSKNASNDSVNESKNSKILRIKDYSCEVSRKNKELLNCNSEHDMILATNDKILIQENVIAKDVTVEKRKGSGEGKALNNDNLCSLSKILVSNKENIHSSLASKDKNTKLLIVKDKNSRDFLNEELEEGELIDENSPDESGVGISNVDEIPPSKVDREKVQERANQRRSSGNSRRCNSITRQTTRVKNAFGNSICERRSPSELFTGDKSLRKINKKGDSHSKIIKSESQHPDDDTMLGNRTSEKRKAVYNEIKLKQKDSKIENRNRQKLSHAQLKISEIDVDKLINENAPTVIKIQNVDNEHAESTDLKKSDSKENFNERNQKTLKQQHSSNILNTNILSSTEVMENACQNIEKRKIKTNKLCDVNQEKLSNISSDSEGLNNKSVHYLQNLISEEPINSTMKEETAQHRVPEKQEIIVSDDKYPTTAKICDIVETDINESQNFCSDILHDTVSSDVNANETKSDTFDEKNVPDNCGISGTTNDSEFTSTEVKDPLVKVHKRKNARMTRSKMNTPSAKGKCNNVFSEKLGKVISDSDGFKDVNCTSNHSTELNKVNESPTFTDHLNKEKNENALTRLNFNSHPTSTKTLCYNENNKQTDPEIPFKENKNHQIGKENLVTSPDTNLHTGIKYQSIANSDPVNNENCDINFTSNIVTSQDNVLQSLWKLSETTINSPLTSPLNAVCKNNEQIDNPKSQIMSNEELIKILGGSPSSANKITATSSDEKISTIGTDIVKQNLILKTPEPSQQSVKTKTIIMCRRSRVRMLQDSQIQTFTISSKLDHKNISNTSTPQTDRRNEFIKENDVTFQNKLENYCALSKVAVSKDTAPEVDGREKNVSSDSKDKSDFTNHTTKNLAIAFSDVFGSDNSDDSSDQSDDSVYIPKKRRRMGRGQTSKKKKRLK